MYRSIPMILQHILIIYKKRFYVDTQGYKTLLLHNLNDSENLDLFPILSLQDLWCGFKE